MPQSQLLVSALKSMLKSHNMTYKMVADHLSLSEASVKRLFARSQLSLERIDAICEMLGIELCDLLQKMQQMTKRITQLTVEQEKKIISDRKLCLITICVVNHWTFAEIINFYHIDPLECTRYLAELDALKLIELLPKNKIKLLISPRFNWIPNGPIQKFFQQYILNDYLASNFQNANEEMICQFGMLTPESNALLRKKMRHLAEEFTIMSERDSSEVMQNRYGSVCFLMTRPWSTAIFNEFIKSK